MEIKYYLPKIKELHIYNYDLYKCPVDIKFSPKLNLVFGTNGLGKTTLLNILQYSIIGPYTGKVKSRNWKDQQKLKRPMLDKNYFRNRMSNQNQQAEVKVVYSLGDDLYEVWHSLYEYKANVIKEFNQRFPQYKDELKVFSSNNDELTFAFHGINHITTLSKLNHDYGLENWKDDELLWLNITNLFDHITSVYERDKLGDTIDKLAENIKAQLIEISKRADVDMNTLWISFKTSMEDLENDLKLDKTT